MESAGSFKSVLLITLVHVSSTLFITSAVDNWFGMKTYCTLVERHFYTLQMLLHCTEGSGGVGDVTNSAQNNVLVIEEVLLVVVCSLAYLKNVVSCAAIAV